jgi:sporulation protein YlmC with PRC-barrel domain
MAHYGILRDFRFANTDEAADDIRGSQVYGRGDEKLGKIDDVIFDHSSGNIRYLVIDTGGWLSSKKFLVPPDRLGNSTQHQGDFEIDADKRQIETFPPYDEEDLGSDEKWQAYEKRYESAWHDGPVQHRKGSDHNITPTVTEAPPEPGSIGSQLTPSERAEASSRIIPAGSDEVTISNGGTGIGGRWLTFESRLRQRRRDITQACTTCSIGPASDRATESSDRERKAI